MKKILVTGGAGFIGSNFVRYLLSKHHDCRIVNLDKLTYAGNLDNLSDIKNNPKHKFVRGDITDKKFVEKVVSDGVDAIVNFAAETHVDRSILSAGSFLKTDVFGTYVLLEAVKKYKVKRFIQISTDEVYGSIKKGSFTEDDPLRPNSPYAASKAAGDLLVRSYFKTYNLPVIITRSSNNFGPNQYPEKLIPLFVINALTGKKLPLYGDGKNVRNWLYVMDNCAALDLVLHKGKIGEIYNIGGMVEVENRKIADIIIKETGVSYNQLKRVADRPGHDRRYSLNSGKVKKLGWKPSTNFKKQLKDTIVWYKNNRKWWEKIINQQKSFKDFYASWYNR